MRVCTRCGVEREDSGFRKGHVCRKCDAAYSLAWAKRNPEKHKLAAKRWRKRNPCHKTSPTFGILQAYADRFGMPVSLVSSVGTLQLCLCKSDEARRILLGISEKFEVASKKPARERIGVDARELLNGNSASRRTAA